MDATTAISVVDATLGGAVWLTTTEGGTIRDPDGLVALFICCWMVAARDAALIAPPGDPVGAIVGVAESFCL